MSSVYKNIPLPTNTLRPCMRHLELLSYKGLSESVVLSNVISGSVVLSNVIEHDDICVVKHIMSLGVIDINMKINVFNNNCPIRIITRETDIIIDIYPIHYAIYSNDPAKLRLLLDHGAIIPPLTKYSLHDLLSHTHHKILGSRIEVNKEIPEIILNEYIKKRDFSIFFNRKWTTDKRVFKWFCDILSSVPRGLETGHNIPKSCENIRICNNIRCRKLSDNLRICNGLFLCEECTTSREGPGQEPLNESNYIDKLWEEPYSADHYLCYPKFIDEEDDQDDWYVSDH